MVWIKLKINDIFVQMMCRGSTIQSMSQQFFYGNRRL